MAVHPLLDGSGLPGLRNRARQPAVSSSPEAGVTLIELLIAITLVAALSAGMLVAMRTSLVTLEKVNDRLQFNRRVMGIEQILTRQIGGVMPVITDCASSTGQPVRIPTFNGTAQTLRMVSTYSMSEGARGYPRFLEFQVIASDAGGLRLIVNEHLYSGPASTAPFCLDSKFVPVAVGQGSFVLADRLAYCRILYREPRPDSPLEGKWVPIWTHTNLPSAVRVEMAPLTADQARLPVVTVNVPIRVTRDVGAPYNDLQ